MNVEDIDIIHLEPLQALLAELGDAFFDIARLRLVPVTGVEDLRSDHCLVTHPELLDDLAHYLLVPALHVVGGGVEMAYAELVGSLDEGCVVRIHDAHAYDRQFYSRPAERPAQYRTLFISLPGPFIGLFLPRECTAARHPEYTRGDEARNGGRDETAPSNLSLLITHCILHSALRTGGPPHRPLTVVRAPCSSRPLSAGLAQAYQKRRLFQVVRLHRGSGPLAQETGDMLNITHHWYDCSRVPAEKRSRS